MTLREMQEFIASNKDSIEVQNFVTSLIPSPTMTPDLVAPYLETPEGFRLVQPYADRMTDKALKTFRENHFEKEVKSKVAAELLRLNPNETPEQTQIRELREAVEKSESARATDNMKRNMVEESSRLGLDPFFVDDYLPSSLEVGKVFIGKMKKWSEGLLAQKANEILSTGLKPGSGNGSVDPTTLSGKDRQAFYMQQTEARLPNAN